MRYNAEPDTSAKDDGSKQMAKPVDQLPAKGFSPEDESELTQEVGKRVRAMRSRRGLSRKTLSAHADVSERYLAQLELGSANISMVLLARIAAALGVPIGMLLPERHGGCVNYQPLTELISNLSKEEQERAYQILHHAFRGDQENQRGVALIGLRGGGKSTLGRALAESIGIPFIRLHDMITRMAGMEMDELISLTGQGTYRNLERRALEQIITEYPKSVVETGGSLVSEPETFDLLRSNFFTIWIQAKPEDHMNRVIAQGDMRPMADTTQAMDDLKLMLQSRDQEYRMADFHLMTSGHTVEQSLETLKRACAPYLLNEATVQ